VTLLGHAQLASSGNAVPLREAASAASRCRMLRDKYWMAAKWCLLSIIDWIRGREAARNEIARVIDDHSKSFRFQIVALFGAETEPGSER
jgi:hypothetical protein